MTERLEPNAYILLFAIQNPPFVISCIIVPAVSFVKMEIWEILTNRLNVTELSFSAAFESGISGLSGIPGVSGRCAADAAQFFIGTLHRRV